MFAGRESAAMSGSAYRSELKRVDFDTERGDVLLLELTSQVTLDEGGLLMKFHQLPLLHLEACLSPCVCPEQGLWCSCNLQLTFPVPPSPTRTSLNSGTVAAMVSRAVVYCGVKSAGKLQFRCSSVAGRGNNCCGAVGLHEFGCFCFPHGWFEEWTVDGGHDKVGQC